MDDRRPSHRAIPSRLLRALGGVGDELALHGPSREALDGIVRAISLEFGYQRVAVYLLSEVGFEKASHVGYDSCHLDPTIGVVARALTLRKPQFVPDVSRDRDYVAAEDGVLSEICVPIIERSEVLGILNVETIAPLALSRDDLAFIRAVADRLAAAVVLARDRKDLAHRMGILDRLASASARIAESLDLELVVDAVVAAAGAVIEGADVQLELLPPLPGHRSATNGRYEAGERGVRKSRAGVGDRPKTAAAAAIDIVLPLRIRGNVYGRLWWRAQSRAPFTIAERQAAELLVLQAAFAFANASAHSAVTSLSVTDALTGLPNRRHFDQSLEERRHTNHLGDPTPTSVLALDLDRFGLVNKRYGHSTGDAVLRGFADVLRASLRERDVFARTGGEEFVAILDETTESDAITVAERIRQSFSAWELEVEAGALLRNTVSIGVASGNTMPLEDLIESADRALRQAKGAGRNRVEVAVPTVGISKSQSSPFARNVVR